MMVPSIRLEDEVREEVLLMKVDVEGYEWSVMEGARGLINNYNVENIVMEYSPG
jgi:FkbM family methyltransferase